MSQQNPVVIIVGGGFGGLATARALKKAPVTVVLIDRTNHNQSCADAEIFDTCGGDYCVAN
jgi:2-polyprenyl-6-methoxyphenol hydroxylase-like FAD-dependent oxidoreductase